MVSRAYRDYGEVGIHHAQNTLKCRQWLDQLYLECPDRGRAALLGIKRTILKLE